MLRILHSSTVWSAAGARYANVNTTDVWNKLITVMDGTLVVNIQHT